MALGVAFYVAVAASVSAAYVESEAQKTKARTIRGIRSREAEDITKKNIDRPRMLKERRRTDLQVQGFYLQVSPRSRKSSLFRTSG